MCVGRFNPFDPEPNHHPHVKGETCVCVYYLNAELEVRGGIVKFPASDDGEHVTLLQI